MPGDSPGPLVPIELGLVDVASGSVQGASPATLSPQERALFAFLAERPGETVSKENLLSHVWGYASGTASRTVYSTIQRLRNKVERDPASPNHIQTIGREGYRFSPLHPQAPVHALQSPAPHAPLDAFVGRERLLTQLGAWLMGQDSPPLALIGPPGIGKSRLAQEFTLQRQGDLPSGVHQLSLHGGGLQEALLSLASSTGLRASPGPRLGQRLARGLTSKGRGVLVVDCAQPFQDLGGLLSALTHARLKILIISRAPLLAPIGTVLPELDSLHVLPLGQGPNPEDGAALFIQRVRDRWPRWMPSREDHQAIRELVTELGGSPLALELAAHAAQVLPPVALLQQIRSGHADLQGGLARGIQWAWNHLALEDQSVARLLCLFPADFEFEAAQQVIGTPLLDPMTRLLDRGMLQVHTHTPPRRFQVPAAIRSFLARQPAVDDSQTRARFVQHFSNFGGSAATEVLVRHGGAAEFARLGQELNNLLQAHAWSTGNERGYLTRAITNFWIFHGHDEPAASLIHPLIQDFDHSRPGGLPGELSVWLLRHWADAVRRAGRVSRATEALNIALTWAKEAAPDRVGSVLHNLGIFYQMQGETDKSKAHFESALVEHHQNQDLFRIGLSTGEMATLALRQGNYRAGVALCKDALAVLRGVNAPYAEAIYLGNMAVAHLYLGELDLAESCFQQALGASRELEVHQFVVGNLSNLGLLYAQQDRQELAVDHYRQALDAVRTLGDEMEEAITLSNLGILYTRMGELAAARRCLDQAQAAMESLNLVSDLVTNLLGRAALCRSEGDRERAGQRLDQAKAMMAEGKHQASEPWLLAELGLNAQDPQDRTRLLEQARAAAQASGLDAWSNGGRAIARLATELL